MASWRPKRPWWGSYCSWWAQQPLSSWNPQRSWRPMETPPHGGPWRPLPMEAHGDPSPWGHRGNGAQRPWSREVTELMEIMKAREANGNFKKSRTVFFTIEIFLLQKKTINKNNRYLISLPTLYRKDIYFPVCKTKQSTHAVLSNIQSTPCPSVFTFVFSEIFKNCKLLQ